MAKKKAGFTLVELSIVLVILGLLVGGVLAGQSLFASAEIHSQMGQFEKFSVGARAFAGKYGSLPGDVPSTAAAGLTSRTGGRSHGDKNGVLSGCLNSTLSSSLGGENLLFWKDLSTQGLIENSFGGPDCDPTNGDCTVANPSTVIPVAKIGSRNMITVYGDINGKNYYQIVGSVTSVNTIGSLVGANAAVTPAQAYSIDTKMDDGAPLTGSVRAVSAVDLQGNTCNQVIPAFSGAAAPASGVCVSNVSGNPYNININAGADAVACSLRLPI